MSDCMFEKLCWNVASPDSAVGEVYRKEETLSNNITSMTVKVYQTPKHLQSLWKDSTAPKSHYSTILRSTFLP